MSLVTDLVEGKITPAAFIEGAATDIKKDAGLFNALPFAKPLETWAIGQLSTLLSGKLSPTVVALIVNGLENALGLTPPPAA